MIGILVKCKIWKLCHTHKYLIVRVRVTFRGRWICKYYPTMIVRDKVKYSVYCTYFCTYSSVDIAYQSNTKSRVVLTLLRAALLVWIKFTYIGILLLRKFTIYAIDAQTTREVNQLCCETMLRLSWISHVATFI